MSVDAEWNVTTNDEREVNSGGSDISEVAMSSSASSNANNNNNYYMEVNL